MKRMKFLHGLLFIFLHPEHKMLLRHSVLGELGCSRSRHFQSKERKTMGKALLAVVEHAACRGAELPDLLVAGAYPC